MKGSGSASFGCEKSERDVVGRSVITMNGCTGGQ